MYTVNIYVYIYVDIYVYIIYTYIYIEGFRVWGWGESLLSGPYIEPLRGSDKRLYVECCDYDSDPLWGRKFDGGAWQHQALHAWHYATSRLGTWAGLVYDFTGLDLGSL